MWVAYVGRSMVCSFGSIYAVLPSPVSTLGLSPISTGVTDPGLSPTDVGVTDLQGWGGLTWASGYSLSYLH